MRVKKYLHSTNILLTSILLLGVTLPALGQTPDGMPPANEGMCDVLKARGITSSLYGLCVAYCEALDCDLQQPQPGDAMPQCKTPSDKILERYSALKKATDPQMPCIQQQACPCWTAQEIGAIGLTWSPHEVTLFPNDFSPSYIRYTLLEFNGGAYQYADVWYFPEQQPAAQCVYVHYDSGDPATPLVRSQGISVPQAHACGAQIKQQIDNLGSNGVPITCLGNLCP